MKRRRSNECRHCGRRLGVNERCACARSMRELSFEEQTQVEVQRWRAYRDTTAR